MLVVSFFKRRKYWIIFALLLSSIFFFLFISIFTYSSQDVDDFYPRNMVVQNWGGKTGAAISQFLYKWFGMAAYLLPFIVLIPALFTRWPRYLCVVSWTIWYALFVVWICTLASFMETPPVCSFRMPSYGGIVGLFLTSFLKLHLGSGGGVILFLAGMVFLFYAVSLAIEQKLLQKGKKLPASGVGTEP